MDNLEDIKTFLMKIIISSYSNTAFDYTFVPLYTFLFLLFIEKSLYFKVFKYIILEHHNITCRSSTTVQVITDF